MHRTKNSLSRFCCHLAFKNENCNQRGKKIKENTDVSLCLLFIFVHCTCSLYTSCNSKQNLKRKHMNKNFTQLINT